MPKKSRYSDYAFAKNWVSVSQVCGLLEKPYLYKWYGTLGWEQAHKVNSNSKKIGDLIDYEICQYFVDKSIKEVDQAILNDQESKNFYLQSIRNFHTFADKYTPCSVLGQQVVYSKEYKYIGTFDRLVIIEDKLVLVDWKATNSVSYEYGMQLEAYYRALTEMVKIGTIILERDWHEYPMWLVQFPKKEEMNLDKNIIRYKSSDLRFNNFLNLLKFYYGKLEDEKEIITNDR